MLKDGDPADGTRGEFELLRRVSGPSLADRVRQNSPRWNALMTAAEEVGLAPGKVYGTTLDGGAGRLSPDSKYPYERVALVVDRASRSVSGEKEYVIGEHDSLVREYSFLGPDDPSYRNAQEALRLLRDVVYPDYFQEPTAG